MKNRSLSVWLGLAALLVVLGAGPTYTVLYLTGASSGMATIQPPAAAGTPILTLPTVTGTLATRTGSITTGNCAKFDSSSRIVDSGGTCGSFVAPDRTVTSCGSCTVLAGDMGGQINYNGSSLTAVIPAISGTVLAAGMQVVLTNQHSTALTISTTPTLNGYSGSTIPQYGGLACTSNGTSLDCLALGTAAGGSGGSVTTTGTPANGELTKFSGSTSVTTGNLSGDVSTSGSLVTTVGKVNGVTYGTSPSTNTVPVITSSNTVTYEAVPNAALANAATTVNGQTCTLGSTCTITASAGTVTSGTTTVAGGSTGQVLYDNGGVLGEKAVTGTGNVVLATSPTLVTPALGTPSSGTLTNATGLPTTALTGTVTSEKCVSWDSTTSVTAQTVSFPVEWTSYTITSTKSAVNGGGSFTANVKIGSTSVTSCSAINVSGATNTATSCTAANTGSANDIINVVITAPTGTVNQAYVCPTFTHTVN
jgi:hypothetical protein